MTVLAPVILFFSLFTYLGKDTYKTFWLTNPSDTGVSTGELGGLTVGSPIPIQLIALKLCSLDIVDTGIVYLDTLQSLLSFQIKYDKDK
jgi:hypothetical protein